ncbi:single-stranded DNA-binding protein [Ligilactobacillus agilis]|uniref:single-stranded DNA-binding protein n=1 Tax=Ligilactobacillus agilis TaxID=1601 RepID=UPI00195D5AA3|nr:single-stranded DNA-binding protein [Ligilactobacillus agilis]MBM6773468.1 single-stranded DNA-binding protein [Ligilactobacillus agilis]
MINNVSLTGRLTKDIDLRYTQSGVAVASFTLAVNRNYKDQDGNQQTDFIQCQIWRKAAENFANFTHKGSLVGIEGRIQTRNYDNQQGQKVYVTEVIVTNFSLLEPRNAQGNNQEQPYQQPSQAPSSQTQGWEQSDPQVDASELPF